MKKRISRAILLIVFIAILTSSAILVAEDDQTLTALTSISNNELLETTQENNNPVETLQVEYNNSDIKGIISIENTNFRYPIAQTTNNDYYLNHNYNKEYDAYGAIYADYRINLDTSRKILIYGHSSTKYNVPFNYLEEYYDEYFYQTHKYITLQTTSNTYRYEIFSVHIETTDFTYMNLQFTDQEWYNHLVRLKNKSIYHIDSDLSKEDEILILQTCSNHSDYQNNSKKYLLIVSRRV